MACRSLESIFEAVEQNRSQWAFCEKNKPSLWVAQRNTPNLRIQVLDVTMSCRVHDSFSQCGRFSARPANFVTEHTRRAKNCVLIHGHNLSAARHPIAG